MTWRGSTTTMERVFASLPYLLPLVEVFKYGSFLMTQLPILGVLFLPILPLLKVYYGVRYAGLLVFFALFTLVVRSERIGHFIRFNTMQAILLDISIFLFVIVSGSLVFNNIPKESSPDVSLPYIYVSLGYLDSPLFGKSVTRLLP